MTKPYLVAILLAVLLALAPMAAADEQSSDANDGGEPQEPEPSTGEGDGSEGEPGETSCMDCPTSHEPSGDDGNASAPKNGSKHDDHREPYTDGREGGNGSNAWVEDCPEGMMCAFNDGGADDGSDDAPENGSDEGSLADDTRVEQGFGSSVPAPAVILVLSMIGGAALAARRANR